MKYDPDNYVGPLEIIEDPVPGSATTQRRRRSDGQLEGVPAVEFLSELHDWSIRNNCRVLRAKGPTFYYEPL